MGCSSCKKCEFIRTSAFCGKTKLTQKQLYSKNGYCSEYEPKDTHNQNKEPIKEVTGVFSDMADIEKVIKGLPCLTGEEIYCETCPYSDEYGFGSGNGKCKKECASDAVALLKEQEAMNVDAFVQWCIDSHIMGDATVSGIKYWVGKYKETNEGR